ncbi:DEAD/DEAH box helicase family protein [Adlercreutzia shanghongiae]|uniref:DEAD/DEAH box helicase family protein n=1 Tax=Adlercreutzia shanghongiae TaxID=3111773 RepID=A0ABU6J0X2_9ACTN|nr:DEAD/DEAH box helicase family protein [Adlercreutzia sp. R22]MEC4295419.1 DEAD/DEAH box helicase family protein [Adlercreutzia sp. R22]
MEKLMSETDYLNAMLNGAGTATPDQQAILEHPRKGARSTLVRIKGEAGTGKTFCLLAKLLGEAGRYPRDPRERWARQPVLFVCFNREMANYARHLIHPFPQAPLIHVTTFDSLVVGLMLKHLEKNSRPGTSDGPAPSVDYSFELVRAAMQEVAQRHPEERSKYYLDVANKRNVHFSRSSPRAVRVPERHHSRLAASYLPRPAVGAARDLCEPQPKSGRAKARPYGIAPTACGYCRDGAS